MYAKTLPTLWTLGSRRFDPFQGLLFLFFFTLHADALHLSLLGYTFRLNNLLGVVLFMILAARFRLHLVVVSRRLFIAILLIGLSIFLSLLVTPYPQRCYMFFGWYGLTMLLYVLLPYLLVSLFDENKLFKLYFASFLCVGLYACFQLIASVLGFFDPFAGQRFLDHFVRPNAFAYEPSFYALYMTPFVMMINYHYLISSKQPLFLFRSIKLKHVILVNLLFLTSTATSAVFAYLIFFSVYIFLANLNRKEGKFRILIFSFILLAFVGVVAIFFPYLLKTYYFKFFYAGLAHYSFIERWAMILNCWHLFLEHPLLGVGLGGVPVALYDVWAQADPTYLFIFQDNLISEGLSNRIKFFEPSNVFTEILASLGIVGTIAFLYLVGIFFAEAKRVYHKRPDLVLNIAVSMFVMLFVLQFNQGLFRTYVWTHIALMFALLEKIGLGTTQPSLEVPHEEVEVQS